MIVFQSSKGRVIKLADAAAAGRIQLLGKVDPGISYDAQAAIITRLTVSQQVNLQFLHTIGNSIYIYTFGDRIGQMGLSGLAFTDICGDGEAAASPGLELMYKWFKDNRASARQKPARITVGKTPLEGFVTGFNADVVDPASMLVQWGITMATLPEKI